MNQWERHKKLVEIDDIMQNRDQWCAIHYLCTDFTKPEESRITAIAIKKLGSPRSVCFSLHKSRQNLLAKKPTLNEEDIDLEVLERDLLQNFLIFLYQNPDLHYLHWNMETAEYGFEALEQRCKHVFGQSPVVIAKFNDENIEVPIRFPSEHMKCNLAQLLKDYYCDDYVKNPSDEDLGNIANLLYQNGMEPHFLSFEEEKKALEAQNYFALQNSARLKTEAFDRIIHMLVDGDLKANKELAHGLKLNLQVRYEQAQIRWWWGLVTFFLGFFVSYLLNLWLA